MPEQSFDAPTADKVLEFLEDYALTTYQSRCSSYQTIQGILEEENQVDNEAIKRLLAVCVHDLKEDMKYAVNTLNVIAVILKKIKAGECHLLPQLTTTALAILDFIKKIAPMSKVQTLQMLCFDIFLSFPDETIGELGSAHSLAVIEVFESYFNQTTPLGVRLMPFNILFKMLKTLPPDKRLAFVKDGLGIWFSKVIPTTMAVAGTNNSMVPKILEVLEMLAEELAVVDYANHSQWQTVLENVYTSEKYPAVMKSMLESGNDNWCRLWNVFVKLLKHQITMNRNKHGSPINSMLPVVEMAFKMDVPNRCRAFQCWNVLIDSFSTETNENFVMKQIKLLAIPLKSNNAKVEETALAKFNTCWHLIRKFHHRLDKQLEIVFNLFLHFCFGNPKHGEDKNILVPGLAFPKTTKKCVQAFVEVTGHTNCECPANKLPKLPDKILDPKVLLDCLTDWVYALKVFTKLLSSEKCVYGNKEGYLRCAWGSFLNVVAEMTEDRRHVAYGELLAMMTQLSQVSQDQGTQETVFKIITTYMVGTKKMWKLLLRENDNTQTSQLYKTLQLLLSPNLHKFYEGTDPKSSVENLRPLTDLLLNHSKTPNDLLERILLELTPNENTVLLWAALLESATEGSCDVTGDSLKNLLLWPLRHLDSVENAQLAAAVWNSSYDKLKPRLKDSGIEKDISVLLLTSNQRSTNQFALYALLQIIRDLLATNNSTELKIEAELLVSILSKVKSHEQMEPVLPVIIDSLVIMMKRVGESKNASLAEYTLTAFNTTLRLLLESARSSGPTNEHCKNAEKLLTPLEEQFKMEPCIKFKCLLVEQLIACAAVFDKHQTIKDIVCSILKTFLKKSKATEVSFYSVVNEAIVTIEKGQKPNATEKFTSPKVLKKTKMKEANIVNTVVENGEEYVVVKSNWKFNPRKLTEKQKEKLKRKREDIPALYQDLSQSQDEFKMAAWKTDSQDTSTSNSASKSNSKTSDATTVLKSMPSTNVVPQIMENIFAETKSGAENLSDKVTNENTTIKVKKPTALTPKLVKSPRVALKDRVFQNVRNLIEKSNLKEGESPKDLNKTMSNPEPKTPVAKAITEATATYSAPPKISLDRPARVKRKPKKYELDFTESSKRKRRNSVDSSESDKVGKSSSDSYDEDMKVEKTAKVVETVRNNDIELAEVETVKVVETETRIKNELTVPVESVKEKVETDTTIKVDEPTDNKKIKAVDADVVKQPASVERNEIIKKSKKVAKPNIEKNEDPPTPSLLNKTVELDNAKTSNKKVPKKSRIVKELAIDMVEGHPFYNVEEKRSTRKSNSTPVSSRRKALCEKINKTSVKSDAKPTKKITKASEDEPENKAVFVKELTASVKETPEGFSSASCFDDIAMSEDFIESSQDSTLTTISVKSTKSIIRKSPKVLIEKLNGDGCLKSKRTTETQSLLTEKMVTTDVTINEANDFEFSRNKVADDIINLTPDFDTEPVDDNNPLTSSDDVIIINDDPEPIVLNTEHESSHSDTIDIANADTEPIDADMTQKILNKPESVEIPKKITLDDTVVNKTSETANDLTVTFQSTVEMSEDANDSNGLSSPYKDDEQRNQDFLNNTLEISPIKTMSPVPDGRKSPDTDFVVIKLSSPVQTNGEPFDKLGSPEVFTEDKLSPDKRDQTPPREEISVNNTNSPSSSLSLKKNRPQVRSGGRAAQMLGLCVPDNIMNTERVSEVEESKKAPITPARRNLRILYNCESTDDAGECDENTESFLKFKRALPTAECSPAGPILKRKLADIADEATISPASKRKRVSFHDPPVSTTISVQKYIEPLGVRSPQASQVKRAARQNTNMKSPKKLETIFKLDTALTKTVESFVDLTYNSDDMTSLDPTLSVEVVKNDELNDTDPICLPLVNCMDPITNIAAELSSAAMKDLLVKELEGKIETIGDLAKLTELEVNRLCIKAPKVKTAMKALSNYEEKMLVESQDFGPIAQTVEAQIHESTEPEITVDPAEKTIESKDIEMQTDEVSVRHFESQTKKVKVGSSHTQTEALSVASESVQTDGICPWEVVKTYIAENPAIVGAKLSQELNDASKEEIAKNLPPRGLARVFTKTQYSSDDAKHLLESVLENSKLVPKTQILEEYIAAKLTDKEIMLICGKLMLRLHDKIDKPV